MRGFRHGLLPREIGLGDRYSSHHTGRPRPGFPAHRRPRSVACPHTHRGGTSPWLSSSCASTCGRRRASALRTPTSTRARSTCASGPTTSRATRCRCCSTSTTTRRTATRRRRSCSRAAVAGRTKNVGINIAAIILPLHNPIRLAEDLAVLDLVSRGRAGWVFAVGYRREEYEMMGIDIDRRAELMEFGIETLKQAWTGEEFEYNGVASRVMPRPYTQPRPPIVLGGNSKAAARRAARIADGFMPGKAGVMSVYREELDQAGRRPRARDARPRGHDAGDRRRVRRSRRAVGEDRPALHARDEHVRARGSATAQAARARTGSSTTSTSCARAARTSCSRPTSSSTTSAPSAT